MNLCYKNAPDRTINVIYPMLEREAVGNSTHIIKKRLFYLKINGVMMADADMGVA